MHSRPLIGPHLLEQQDEHPNVIVKDPRLIAHTLAQLPDQQHRTVFIRTSHDIPPVEFESHAQRIYARYPSAATLSERERSQQSTDDSVTVQQRAEQVTFDAFALRQAVIRGLDAALA